jgi:hypothetical protein
MTVMTDVQARHELRTWREKHRWSFEQLAYDMRAVLKRETVTARTLSRFDAASHQQHAYTLADIVEYLKKSAKKRAA